MLSGIGIVFLAAAVIVIKARRRAEPKGRSDRVAPNVLARINVEYHDE